MRISNVFRGCSRLSLLGIFLMLVNQAHTADISLGRPASVADIAAIDISIPPDGKGLPPGSGDATAGEMVYEQKCASCHAAGGKGKPADALVGGIGSLSTGKPMKTVGSFWPYATTLFDYIRRSMPLDAPMSLTDDEVYAVTAYVLAINGLISTEVTLDADSLPAVRMPNRDGFSDRSGVQ